MDMSIRRLDDKERLVFVEHWPTSVEWPYGRQPVSPHVSQRQRRFWSSDGADLDGPECQLRLPLKPPFSLHSLSARRC